MVASVSSLLDVLAAVVSPMPARAWSPVLDEGDGAADGVTGHQAGAATESRFAAEPAAPTAIFTVPEATARSRRWWR